MQIIQVWSLAPHMILLSGVIPECRTSSKNWAPVVWPKNKSINQLIKKRYQLRIETWIRKNSGSKINQNKGKWGLMCSLWKNNAERNTHSVGIPISFLDYITHHIQFWGLLENLRHCAKTGSGLLKITDIWVEEDNT